MNKEKTPAARCGVCFRHCVIADGGVGFCGARTAQNGRAEPLHYGRISSLALDPVEKKPFARFCPGGRILSVGSFGCNLRCPFCQNHTISWAEAAVRTAETISPRELAALTVQAKSRGNIGLAFTYNEPLVGYEFVRDTAKLVKAAGMKTAMVTNGTAEVSVLAELAPYLDAVNVDLKGFTDRYYGEVLGGDLKQVLAFIAEAVKTCHVELTTLIVPGENDGEEEMRALSAWVGRLRNPNGEGVPLHISRFFPRFRMTDRAATPTEKVYRLAEIARETLPFVYTGNC